MSGVVFLCQRRPPGVNVVTLATAAIWSPDGDVCPGWDAHQCDKYGEYGLTTLLCNRGRFDYLSGIGIPYLLMYLMACNVFAK